MSGDVLPAVTVDRLDGQQVTVDLLAHHIVKLNCGCQRWECDRPGGGQVHVLVGAHCERLAGATPTPPSRRKRRPTQTVHVQEALL